MEVQQRLKEMSLFQALTDDQLAQWAALFERRSFPSGTEVIREGDPSLAFYIVESGKLHGYVLKDDKKERVALFGPGDYFGETGLLTGTRRNATVETLESAELLVLDKRDFDQLMAEFPDIREQLRVIGKRREKVGRTRFEWQEDDEVTHLFAQKHWIVFLKSLRWVILLGVLGYGATVVYVQATIGSAPALILMLLAGSLFALMVLAGVYQYFDWRNDHYIVTSLRVLHIERVLLLREDRDEAPIDRVQDVQVRQRGILANLLDYGDVFIQTAAATEQVVFENIPRPGEVYDAIFAPYRREADREREREQIQKELRRVVGLETPEPEEPVEVSASEEGEQGEGAILFEALGGAWQWLQGLFNFDTWVESEDGDTITWRKSRWLLASLSIIPGLVGIALVVASIFLLSKEAGSWVAIALLFLLGDWVWWFYVYWDWQNDIYQISGNRLIDLKKRPLFLEEDRRETTLDNVQNVSLSIPGPIANLLNYGTVIIETAGERGAFRFENVDNPRGVQAEIFSRREKLNRERREQQEKEQRERMLMWFEEYEKAKREQLEQGRPRSDQV